MKLIFKQRILSWFDRYDIYNENGDVEYTVKGELAWGHQLRIYDSSYNEVGMIKQRILTLLPAFDLYINNNHIGSIKREFTFLKPKYYFDFNDWKVEGDWIGWDYQIVDSSSSLIATITKELFKFSDTYIIDVENPDNALCALLSVLAIDIDKCSHDN